MPWLLSAGKVITSFLGALVKWVGYLFAYRLGRSKERAKAMEKSKEMQDEQIKIFAQADKHRSDLIADSLRRKRYD